MDDDAQLERDLVLARRLKLGVRLVVLPLLVGALILALHFRHTQRSGDDEGTVAVRGDAVAPATWTGRFGSEDVAAWTVGSRVIGVRTTFALACRDGSDFRLRLDALHLRHDAHVSWYTAISEHERADDGGAMTVDEEVRAWKAGDAVTVGWKASVLWTRRETGQVVRCDGGPTSAALSLAEAGGGA
jgi:hypothetical protein